MEKTYITTDYDIIKPFLERNGPVNKRNEAKVLRMMAIIQAGGLLHPIVINKNFDLLDGQHRLEAHRRLGVPIRYVIRTHTNRI